MKHLFNAFLSLSVIGLLFTIGCDIGRMTDNGTNKVTSTETADSRESGSDPDEQPENGVEEAETADATTDKIPGKDEKAFIPAGWKQEDRITGDLNGDSRPDAVLQIVKENSDTDYNRRMIVLLRTRDGKYTLGAEGKKVIRCTSCNGTFGPGPADIKIEKGVIIVSQLYGSRSATDYLHRFRYEKGTGKFRLIGEDVTNFDRGTGESETTSTNFLNGKQIVTKEQVDESGKNAEVSRNEKSVARTKKYVQDVDYEDY